MYQIHPETRDYILACVTPDERLKFHTVIADYYQKTHNHVEAVYHWREIGAYEPAALILIAHYQEIIQHGHTEELQNLLVEFHPHGLEHKTWVQLKIVAGHTYVSAKDINAALDEYRQALASTDTYYKAVAYRSCAKAFEHLHLLDESLLYYQHGIDLLENSGEHKELLIDIYIGRAWFHIQERPDLDKAEGDLKRVKDLLLPSDSQRRALLHNAWGKLSWLRQNRQQELLHCLEAWTAATEAQSNELMVMTGHNLGHAYVWSEEYIKGRYYLEKTMRLAQHIGDDQHIAKCHKLMGVSFFFQEQYHTAIAEYRQAYDIFRGINNNNWLGDVCCDLAEAYAKIGDQVQGRKFYQEGCAIAQQTDDKNLLTDLSRLANEYPDRPSDLDLEDLTALDYAREKQGITNREYVKLTGLSPKTAERRLKALVKRGLLMSVGRNRAVRYVPKS